MRPLSFLLITFAFALAPPGRANAEWLRADSDHFVVYADDAERDLERFSQQLERFHSAMSFVTTSNTDVPSPSNRVTVYVVDSVRDVRKLHGGDDRYVAGFYLPRAGGSVAIVPTIRGGRVEDNFSMITLLHEYAHHFLISASRFPMPRWMSEGAAEFFASAKFESDGTVWLGRPALHRAGEIYYSEDVTAEELLDHEVYEAGKRRGYDAFYGKAWLLYHYLNFAPERQGQMLAYVKALASGKGARQAALDTFGDFEKLDVDLKGYLNKRRILAFKLAPDKIKIGPVRIARLSEGEAAMMPLVIRSKRGVDEDQAQQLLGEVRTTAARYPSDPAVQAALAEAEFDAGNYQPAIAAADAALAADPRQINAYVQKGYAQFALAEDASDADAAYRDAVKPFLALNKIENDHPLPLIYYYRGFAERGDTPSRLAVEGLERAADLAPFDLGLRMMVAIQQIRDGRKKEARASLGPIAYNPHGGGMTEAALEMLNGLDGTATAGGSGGGETAAAGL